MTEIHTLDSGRHVALGRRAARHDPRTLRLAAYLQTAALPPLPDRVVNSDKVAQWGMFLNDRLGDCTAAGIAHLAMLNGALVRQPVTVTDQDVLALYEHSAGYNPSDPSTDQGAVELDVLNYWRHNAFAAQTPVAFASVDPQNLELVKQAVNLFGAVYVGLNLPRSAQQQDGTVWTTVSGPDAAPGSWGGHCVVITDFDSTIHELRCITWGSVQRLSESFWQTYGDECWAVLTDEWRQVAPSPAVDFAALDADLGQLGSVQA